MMMSNKFKIQILEDHNEALESIYREIGANRLSFNNLCLIHFDSHPDLGIPGAFSADDIFKRDLLFDAISIENWILPAVYAGHLSDIVWIKPNWSTQIKCGRYNLVVGKHKESGRIKCNCTETYFLSDSTYANEADLTNTKQFNLHVFDLNDLVDTNNDNADLVDLIAKSSIDKRLILDIDLDFFSTQDPFRVIFEKLPDGNGSAHYDLFKRVYFVRPPEPPSSINNSQDYSIELSSYADKKSKRHKLIWTYLLSEGDGEIVLDDEDSELLLKEDLLKLNSVFKSNPTLIDMELMHEYGMCIDDKPLPHNVSTEAELNNLLDSFTRFLEIFFSKETTKTRLPNLITIARSSLDDYCPPNQVDKIQEETLKCIKGHFGIKSIRSIDLLYEQ